MASLSAHRVRSSLRAGQCGLWRAPAPAVGERNSRSIWSNGFTLAPLLPRTTFSPWTPVRHCGRPRCTREAVVDDGTKLGARKGLPQDLLFLTGKHPRHGWRSQPALAGVGEMWLANHDGFRALTTGVAGQLNRIREDNETSYESGPALRNHIGRLL